MTGWEWPVRAGAGLRNRTMTPNGPLESRSIVTRPPTPDLVAARA